MCGLEAFDLCIISNVLNYLQDDASCDKLCALLLGGRTKAILLNERGALQGMADKVVRLDVGRNNRHSFTIVTTAQSSQQGRLLPTCTHNNKNGSDFAVEFRCSHAKRSV